MTKQIKTGDVCVLETEDVTLVGFFQWSDKSNFKFMLEFLDPFKYHQRIYFNNARNLRKLEIAQYECFRTNESYARRRIETSVGRC